MPNAHRSDPAQDMPWAGRALLLAVACLAAGAGGALAWHHPLSGAAALGLFALLAVFVAARPTAWLVLWPVLLPVMGLAPWTGWITFEESDLLTLAVAAGGFGRWAFDRAVRRGEGQHRPTGLGWAWVLLLLWTADVILAATRGVIDAGGWAWSWYDAYRSPMNALRLAKPTLALWLLLPLWLHAANARSRGAPGTAHAEAVDRLTLGLALGHGLTACICLGERLAYPGLLDFSTDYRTTGPFWEMHVGGAALDGFLAMTFPFAWQAWRTARTRGRWLLAAGCTLVGAYAAVTTFSRIVYLALPLSVLLMLALSGPAGRLEQPSWRAGHRRQIGLIAVLGSVLLGCWASLDGEYMLSRLQQAPADGEVRLQHWSSTLARLGDESNHWFGQGLGRFLDHYALEAPPKQRPGDLRLVPKPGAAEAGGSQGWILRMVAGNHQQGWGELLRLSQRVRPPTGPLSVSLTVRVQAATTVHAEVCFKHLLYDDGCHTAMAQIPLKQSGDEFPWQVVQMNLDGKAMTPGPWWRVRQTVFSVATEGPQSPMEVQALSLKDVSGQELLTNRQFELGGAHWFFSSDRFQIAWHAQNLVVHLLYEQGYVGLVALVAMTLLAMGRLCAGRASRHALAPALAAALVGFWTIGLVDSQFDLPRIATLYLLLVGIALGLKNERAP